MWPDRAHEPSPRTPELLSANQVPESGMEARFHSTDRSGTACMLRIAPCTGSAVEWSPLPCHGGHSPRPQSGTVASPGSCVHRSSRANAAATLAPPHCTLTAAGNRKSNPWDQQASDRTDHAYVNPATKISWETLQGRLWHRVCFHQQCWLSCVEIQSHYHRSFWQIKWVTAACYFPNYGKNKRQ